MNVWSLVPKRLLNSLLESATSKWLQEPEVVKLSCSIVFIGDAKTVEYKKHLQVIVNQHIDRITDTLALLIWKLFTIDEKGQSNQQLQDRILSICLGSNTPKDSVLLDIIKRIESNLGVTWTNRVFSWDFQSSNNIVDNYDKQPTFVTTKDGFEVSLDIELIKNSVRNFNPLSNFSIEEGLTLAECQEAMKKFTLVYHTNDVYNSEFLLMSLASSLEIFKENGGVDLKVLVESYGLGFVFCCLSSEVQKDLFRAAKNIVGAIAYFLSEESELKCSYREKSTIKLLVSKILNYFSPQEEERYLPSCVCIMMGLTLPIFTNPGHFLNEKSIEFLLSGPSLRGTELPLFQLISKTTSEHAAKEMQWLIQTLGYSLATQNDVAIYMQKGVFEYVLALKDSVHGIQVEPLIRKAQETSNGSMSLITRNGILSWVSNELSSEENKTVQIRKLGTAFVVTSDKDRLNDWTDGCVNEFMVGMKGYM